MDGRLFIEQNGLANQKAIGEIKAGKVRMVGE